MRPGDRRLDRIASALDHFEAEVSARAGIEERAAEGLDLAFGIFAEWTGADQGDRLADASREFRARVDRDGAESAARWADGIGAGLFDAIRATTGRSVVESLFPDPDDLEAFKDRLRAIGSEGLS